MNKTTAIKSEGKNDDTEDECDDCLALGAHVRDTITGYVGTLTSRTSYLHGNTRVTIQARVGADGKVPEPLYCDEDSVRRHPKDGR
jgi:hypothetical protein